MSRFVLRRGRVLPGPLKPLALETPPAGGLMVASLSATAMAVALTLLVLPQIRPAPAIPGRPPATEAVSRPAPVGDPVETAALANPPAAPLAAAVSPAPEPSRSAPMAAAAEPAAPPVPVKAASAKPAVAKRAAVAPSLFDVDLLPALQGSDAGLGTAASPAPPRKTVARRSATRAVAATEAPAQP